LTECIAPLEDLFRRLDDVGNEFRCNIRAYNNIFAFTSMGVRIDKNLANANHGLDQRTYNVPTASQVAAIWVEGYESTNLTTKQYYAYKLQIYQNSPLLLHFGG
ncbi:4043_t:CDS:2, partial [Racocetra fulgida]